MSVLETALPTLLNPSRAGVDEGTKIRGTSSVLEGFNKNAEYNTRNINPQQIRTVANNNTKGTQDSFGYQIKLKRISEALNQGSGSTFTQYKANDSTQIQSYSRQSQNFKTERGHQQYVPSTRDIVNQRMIPSAMSRSSLEQRDNSSVVDLPQIMKPQQKYPPPPVHMDLITNYRGLRKDIKVHLKPDIMNPFDPALGNLNKPATTEDLLIIRERQRELKDLIRVTRGQHNNSINNHHPSKLVKDRMSMIMNPVTEENTLDRYLKEHTHNKLSERPAEVDRTGLLRVIDEIGDNDMKLTKLQRKQLKTYDASNTSSRKMLGMNKAKVNPTRDFPGYEEHLRKEAFQRRIASRVEELREEQQQQRNHSSLVPSLKEGLNQIQSRNSHLTLERSFQTPHDTLDFTSRGRQLNDKLSYLKVSARDGGSSSRRELIDSSRKILFTNIQIMEKKRESEVFKSDLLSETERVRDAKFHFDLDTERFMQFTKEQDTMRTQVTRDFKKARQEREMLDQEINRLTDEIKNTKDQAFAMDNQQISPMKAQKKFLNEVSNAFEQLYDRKATKIISQPKQDQVETADNTFITQNKHKLTLLKSKIVKNPPPIEEDFEIPLTESELRTFLEDLEERNLALFRNIQADDQKMEEMKLDQVSNFAGLQKDLRQINETIEHLEVRKREKNLKLQLVQSMLEQTTASQNRNPQSLKTPLQQKLAKAKNDVIPEGFFDMANSENSPCRRKVMTFLDRMYMQVFRPHASITSQQRDMIIYLNEQNLDGLPLDTQLGQIETQCQSIAEEFDKVLAHAEEDPKYKRSLQAVYKSMEGLRKIKKAEDAKRKEREETDKRIQRNIEKMKKNEALQNDAEHLQNLRVHKLRSRKPRKVKLINRTEQQLTEAQLDYQRYVENI